MLGIAILAAHEDVVTVLQNIPGITWKAKVYDEMHSYSTKAIQKLQFMQPANSATTDPLPDHWDWTEKRPDCMNVVSNIGMCSVSGLVSSANIISDMRCLKNLDQPRVEYSAQFMLNCDTQYKAPLCDDMPVQPNGWTLLTTERFQNRVYLTNLERPEKQVNVRLSATTNPNFRIERISKAFCSFATSMTQKTNREQCARSQTAPFKPEFKSPKT
ncbi:Cathepsin_B [Hexamita inflata]|uniref:Cathepsin_B n=1 Tax=Hexamita inflata TaxID=28002 RepID=A0ABP1M4L6_9EUKA